MLNWQSFDEEWEKPIIFHPRLLLTPTLVYADEAFSFSFHFQLLLILTAVQIVGAIASFTNIPEMWGVYSVTQGVQVARKSLKGSDFN